jgi:hypothetical protein
VCNPSKGEGEPRVIRIVYEDHTFVLRALPPTCGMSKSTPNGAFLSLRSALINWI